MRLFTRLENDIVATGTLGTAVVHAVEQVLRLAGVISDNDPRAARCRATRSHEG
jgi:hypothetical protein